jgi:hypothetical protein
VQVVAEEHFLQPEPQVKHLFPDKKKPSLQVLVAETGVAPVFAPD